MEDIQQASPQAIQRYLDKPELLRDLLLQITKDFQTAGVSLDIQPSQTYTLPDLLDTLQIALHHHLTHNGPLKYLLNRVDLTEKQIKNAVKTPVNQHLTDLAMLIIKRELQKIVIRHWYKKTDLL